MRINNSFEKDGPLNQHFNYILPSLNVRYGQLQLNYSVNATEPNVNDLQPVQDNTNPLFIQQGNPSLKPTINHSLNVNLYKYDMKSNTNYSLYLYGSMSKDAVIRSRTINAKGVQVSTPVNADGIWNAQSSMNISKQLKFSNSWKFSYGGRFWINYRKSLVILNEKRSGTDNISLNPGLNISFNWDDKFELRQNYGLGWNKGYYRDNIFPELSVLTHNSGSEIIIRLPKHWVWESSLNYIYNPQVAEGIQKSVLRWNAAVNFLFLKDDKGQFKLSVYDLLNQNITVYRQVTENYINDVETNILRRYFMLTFTYNIRNLGAKSAVRNVCLCSDSTAGIFRLFSGTKQFVDYQHLPFTPGQAWVCFAGCCSISSITSGLSFLTTSSALRFSSSCCFLVAPSMAVVTLGL